MANRMKSYVYTYNSKWERAGYTMHTATLCRIKRNKLVFIGTKTCSFVSEIQLVKMILAEHKEIPAKVLENSHSAWDLKEAGIADIQRI
jgi:hypothetical protein